MRWEWMISCLDELLWLIIFDRRHYKAAREDCFHDVGVGWIARLCEGREKAAGSGSQNWQKMALYRIFFIYVYGSWDCTLVGEAGLISSIGSMEYYHKIVVV